MAFIVAIDGPAGSGKGTVANIIGKKLKLLNIDTGAMFRCVALELLRRKININEEEKIKDVLKNIKIELIVDNEENIVKLNGEDVSLDIRKEEVSNFVSPVSKLKIVRNFLLDLQREIANNKDVVMEGRDIGSVVFPNADVKIYLDASPEERAKRRVLQNKEKGIESDYETVLENIKVRDERDATREIAPLKKAEDAIIIDSTYIGIEEVSNKIIDIINNKRGCK